MSNSKQKPAYFVASSFMPEGHGSLMPYGEAAHPLIEKYEGELIVAGHTNQDLEQLEGEWKPESKLTIFKFPSMEHLKGFWEDPEYIAIKHLRHDVTPPNFTMAVDAYDPSDFSYELE